MIECLEKCCGRHIVLIKELREEVNSKFEHWRQALEPKFFCLSRILEINYKMIGKSMKLSHSRCKLSDECVATQERTRYKMIVYMRRYWSSKNEYIKVVWGFAKKVIGGTNEDIALGRYKPTTYMGSCSGAV
ncbi:hypothetical protein CR513_52952, partial [Mucuna pruriens]